MAQGSRYEQQPLQILSPEKMVGLLKRVSESIKINKQMYIFLQLDHYSSKNSSKFTIHVDISFHVFVNIFLKLEYWKKPISTDGAF